ncbi:MAG: hypothetical protein WKG03_19955 [Telluria sp.]
MNSNQRSQGNNQSSNGGNEKSVSSSRGGTVEKDYQHQDGAQSEQSGKWGSVQQDAQIGQQSTDRTGSQTGSEQQGQPGQKQSNDLAGGYPRSPSAGGKLAADENMDDDTGLSNRANRQSAEQDQGNKQAQQSNVGRRDDGTPD